VAGGVTIEVHRAGGAVEKHTLVPCSHRDIVAATAPATMHGVPCLIAIEACETCGAHLRPMDPALLSPGARA
jgi:hypothetical protein